MVRFPLHQTWVQGTVLELGMTVAQAQKLVAQMVQKALRTEPLRPCA